MNILSPVSSFYSKSFMKVGILNFASRLYKTVTIFTQHSVCRSLQKQVRSERLAVVYMLFILGKTLLVMGKKNFWDLCNKRPPP